MIAYLSGVLAQREGEMLVVITDGGVGYAVTVPLRVAERLPAAGERVSLHTELVVREDAWALYGFDRPGDRIIFQRLLGASGFGPRLALALLSALGPERTVRSIRERDIAALGTVPGIGRKKAERLVLELHDRFADIPVESAPIPSGADQAVRALTGLGYAPAAADEAVRSALAEGAGAEGAGAAGAGAEGADGPSGDETAAVVRRALQYLAAARAGR
ncbi:MAG TPA: Holliday junction branch migration protein RuvA [Gemmatimonadales bacterium]|nr:Holliday junction branch migration protein RuvA [Gemmatimonadales bacterium]